MIKLIQIFALLLGLAVAVFVSDIELAHAAESEDESVSELSAQGSKTSQFLKKMSFSFFNFSSANAEYSNRQLGRIESYNYISIGYKFGSGRSIALRPAFLYNFAGVDSRGNYQGGEGRLSDTYISYTDRKVVRLPYKWGLSNNVRTYFPTGIDSQNSGLITRLKDWAILSYQPNSRWVFEFHLQGDYYVQSRRGFLTDRGVPRGSKWFGYEDSIAVHLALIPGLKFSPSIGMQQEWSHDLPIEGVPVYNTSVMKMATAFDVEAKWLVSTFGVEQVHDIKNPRNQLGMYRDEELTYFARTSFLF